MNYNKKLTYGNEDSYNENGLKLDKKDKDNNDKKTQIQKSPNFLQQKKEPNIIIFHKKVSKSPPGFAKNSNTTNDNIDSKENVKPTIKLNYKNIENNNVINNVKLTNDNNKMSYRKTFQ